MKLLPMNQKNKWIIKYENKLEGILSFNSSNEFVEQFYIWNLLPEQDHVGALMYLLIKPELLAFSLSQACHVIFSAYIYIYIRFHKKTQRVITTMKINISM